MKKEVYVFRVNGSIHKKASTIYPGDTIYISQKVEQEKKNWFESVNDTLRFITNVMTPILLIKSVSQ